MVEPKANPWHVEHVDRAVIDRLTGGHVPHPDAVIMGVDIFGDPPYQASW